MTPSPTSEPELVTKPVATADPPQTADATGTTQAATGTTQAATETVTGATQAATESADDATKTTAEASNGVVETTTEPADDGATAVPAVAVNPTTAPSADQTDTDVDAADHDAADHDAADQDAADHDAADHDADADDTDQSNVDAADLDDDELSYPPTKPGHYPTLVPLVGSLVGLVALIVVMIGAFALPAVHGGPNHLPIGVAGPPAITKQVTALFAGLGGKNAHQFDVTVYPQESALTRAIKERKVYGGLSVSDTAATMLLSSASSTTATEDLVNIANSIGGGQIQVAIKDVVPLPKKDPRGFGLASLAWPLVIATLLPALLMFRLYRRRPAAQLAATVAASVLIGFATSAVLTFWLDITAGANFWALGGALSAAVAATSLLVLGLGAIAGRAGVIVGSAVVLLISAPLSGFTSAPEWLPSPWNTLGQLLPAGAAGTLLRSTAYFHAHGAGPSLLVLGAWALVGLLLLVVGSALLPVQDETELVEVDVLEMDLATATPAG